MQLLQDHIAAELCSCPTLGSGEKVNRFTGERWRPDIDPVQGQVDEALLRIAAAEVFRQHGRIGLPLPVRPADCAALIEFGTPFDQVVGLYGRSLAAHRYDVSRHPLFPAYAAAVIASPNTDPEIQSDLDVLIFGVRWGGEIPTLDGRFIWVPDLDNLLSGNNFSAKRRDRCPGRHEA